MDQDADRVRKAMEQFSQEGRLEVSVDDTGVVDPLLLRTGFNCGDVACDSRYGEQYDYLLDPHTAVGVGGRTTSGFGADHLSGDGTSKYNHGTGDRSFGASHDLDALEGAYWCASTMIAKVQRYVVEHI